MLGLIPLRDWLYLGVIIGLIALGAYERQHLINEGENRCLVREREAAAQQSIADAKTNQEAINALNTEITGLLGTDSAGVPAVPRRVQCYASPVPAASSVTGTPRASQPAATGAIVQPVPGGPGAWPDLGPSLQRLALAADILSARDRACLKELKEP